MTSVIIPAHNEEKTLGRTLDALLTGLPEGVEIIVVCNGCSDLTETVANEYAPRVRCISTETPSKANALNLGDSLASSYPRIYLDADIVLTGSDVTAITSKLDEGYLAVSPAVTMDVEDVPWLVRAYYKTWLSLPYAKAGMIGAGSYALSEAGRKRFSTFPDIVADDGFVRASFQEHERTVASDAHAIVRAPRTVGGLIKIKTRSRLGRYELKAKFPEICQNEEKSYVSAFGKMLWDVPKWPEIAAYILVNLYTRARAANQQRLGFGHWERDNSTRS